MFSILLLAILLVYVFYFCTIQSSPNVANPGSNSSLVRGSLFRLGYGQDNFPARSHLWTEKIHLCIMFNMAPGHPLNEKILNLLISYYFPYFKDITIIFDGHPKYNFSSVPVFVNVLLCESHFGWYQHKCIQQCIQQNNSATEGHLYISDDMFINITKMVELDKSKIWFNVPDQTKSMSWIMNPGPKGWGWVWWGPPHGNNIKLNNTIESFPSKWKGKLEKYHGFPDNFGVVGTSDIVFIPETVVPMILPVLEHIILQGDLFCEIATLLAINVASQEFVYMDNGYLWADRSLAGIKRASKTAHFVHPVKLGNADQAALWVDFMEEQLNRTILENKAKALDIRRRENRVAKLMKLF